MTNAPLAPDVHKHRSIEPPAMRGARYGLSAIEPPVHAVHAPRRASMNDFDFDDDSSTMATTNKIHNRIAHNNPLPSQYYSHSGVNSDYHHYSVTSTATSAPPVAHAPPAARPYVVPPVHDVHHDVHHSPEKKRVPPVGIRHNDRLRFSNTMFTGNEPLPDGKRPSGLWFGQVGGHHGS